MARVAKSHAQNGATMTDTSEFTAQDRGTAAPETDLAMAQAICRGTQRLLRDHMFASVTEMGLPNGRRADLVTLGARGEIWIVEIKSSIADFRSDQKWPEYRDYCDQLFFAVSPDFPSVILPPDTGLIVADRFGGTFERPAPEHKLTAPRRKAMTLAVARVAALRLQAISDPAMSEVR